MSSLKTWYYLTNQEIFERIQKKLPFYNREDWVKTRVKNLGYLKNISKYPIDYNPNIRDEANYLKNLMGKPSSKVMMDQFEANFYDKPIS
jgi:hypothetical protein